MSVFDNLTKSNSELLSQHFFFNNNNNNNIIWIHFVSKDRIAIAVVLAKWPPILRKTLPCDVPTFESSNTLPSNFSLTVCH